MTDDKQLIERLKARVLFRERWSTLTIETAELDRLLSMAEQGERAVPVIRALVESHTITVGGDPCICAAHEDGRKFLAALAGEGRDG